MSCYFTQSTLPQAFSAAYFVQSTGFEEAVLAFEACWLSQFCSPDSVHADAAFCKAAFKTAKNL